MSNELITRLYDEAQDNPDSLGWKAADLIEQQQKRIEELKDKLFDAKGKASEKRIELICNLAAAQAQLKVMREALTAAKYPTNPIITLELIEAALTQPSDDSALREMLAGYEAQIKVMREALEEIKLRSVSLADAQVTALEALTQPTDDSSLCEMLKQERERCAKVCDVLMTGGIKAYAAKIRAMGSESPKLICPRCGVDRFKVPCPGPFHLCPIHGEAQ